IGGFSDGTDEGMGFALSAVDGTIVDYVVPLSMDAWIDSSLEDVVAALKAGAYLNVVGASNNNPDTTPSVVVYEMSLVMLNATESSKSLRVEHPDDNNGGIEHHIYSTGTSDVYASCTWTVDFMLSPRVWDDSYSGYEQDPMTNFQHVLLAHME